MSPAIFFTQGVNTMQLVKNLIAEISYLHILKGSAIVYLILKSCE